MQHLSVIKNFLFSFSNKKSTLIQNYSDGWPVSWFSFPFRSLGFGLFIAIGSSSCTQETNKTIENKKVSKDTIQSEFIFTEKTDSLIQNGEKIKYYKNGVIEMQGMMKDGKRHGPWKSYYENGASWSETTFLNGKKNGKTITWYDNENKRYEGFYTNDVESGTWTFWDENGKIQNTRKY